MTLSFVERFVFRHFFDGLALGGAVSTWALLCWLLWPLGFAPPPAVHLVVVAALFAVNRLAALPVQDVRPRPGPFGPRTGHVLLACAFGSMTAAGALAVTAVAWLLAAASGTMQAEAGGPAVASVAPLLDAGFRAVGTAVVGLTAGAVAHGYARGYRAVSVDTLAVPLPGAPDIRLVHVSDFHLGLLADRDAIRDAIDRVLALDPDVVCVSGDLVDSPATDLDAWLPELDRLHARHGVYTILGNHDRAVGVDQVADAVRRHTRWHLLRDEVAVVEVGGRRLWLLGLEDRPEAEKVAALPGLVAQVPPGAPAILIAHRPSVFPAAAAAGLRLTLAGHTHGGQLALPGLPHVNPARLLGTRYDVGTFRRGDAVMRVSRGVGTSGQRVRVAVPCEITVVRIAAA